MWMLWSSLGVAGSEPCEGIQVPEVEPDAARAHIETWQRWAAATGEDVRLHCHALAAVDALPEHEQATRRAEIQQRIDNHGDTLRNVYPLSWWLLADDPVAQPQDGPGDLPDYLETAYDQAWAPVSLVLGAPGAPTHHVAVTCSGDEALCPGLIQHARSEIAAHPRLAERVDSTRPASLGLDISVADQVEAPFQAARIELSTSSGAGTPTAHGVGVGASLVGQRNTGFLALGLGLLKALVIPHLLRASRKEGPSAPEGLKLLATGALGGAVLGTLAPGWLPWTPDPTQLALGPGGWPLPGPLLWAAGLSGLLTLLPLAFTALVVLVLTRRLGLEWVERMDLERLAPAAVAGALGVALIPVGVGMGTTGLMLVAAILLSAVCLTSVAARVLEQLIQGRSPPRPTLSLGLATLGLLALLPMAMPASMPWALATLALGMSLSLYIHQGTRPEATAAPSPRPQPGGGTLFDPVYVGGELRDPAGLARRLQRPGLHRVLVRGPAGSGKTRFAREFSGALPEDWRRGHGEAEAPLGQVRPYALLSATLGELLDTGDLAALQARQSALNEVAGAAGEAALELLPGVGMLLRMGDEDPQHLTRDRLRRDLDQALRELLAERGVLLVLDDLQWADESSLELLGQLLDSLEEAEPPLPRGLIVLMTWRDEGAVPLSSDHQVLLGPLPGEDVARLLAAAGVHASEDFAARVRDRVGGNPRHLLELMDELLAQGLAERDEQGAVHIPSSLDSEALAQAVPGHLHELERARVDRVTEPQDRLLLQAAALCGRRFSVAALAAGFGLARIEVLQRLSRLEDGHRLIEDLDDDESFRFRTELTRTVLAGLGHKSASGELRKVLKEFHFNVVQGLLQRADGPDWDESQDCGELVYHGLHAGQRAQGSTARFALRGAQDAARRCAWPESRQLIAVARERFRCLSPAELDRLDLTEARVLRGLGGRQDLRAALPLFRGLLESEHVDRLEVVTATFECLFALRERSELRALMDEIERIRELVDEEGDSLLEVTCDFYCVLARAEHEGLRPGPAPQVAESLGALVTTLRGLPAEPARDLLMARVLQAQASRTEDEQAYLEASRESLRLKELHGDLPGQALTMGMLGNYFLWWAPLPDPVQAQHWLERDLQLVETMGNTGALSSLLNRLALALWMQRGEDPELGEQALATAQRALARARRNQHAVDLLFAAFSVLRYAAELGRAELLAAVGQELVEDPRRFSEVPAGTLSARLDELDALQGRLDELDQGSWTERLRELLT
jgi:hypothetical protein